jgi:hypothetical protein
MPGAGGFQRRDIGYQRARIGISVERSAYLRAKLR